MYGRSGTNEMINTCGKIWEMQNLEYEKYMWLGFLRGQAYDRREGGGCGTNIANQFDASQLQRQSNCRHTDFKFRVVK